MRKPVVDYKGFRLSRINEPQFAHLKWLLPWLIYFALYFITENFIPHDVCYVVHSPIDDMIPFCEVFVVPYVLWYFLIAYSLVYFALYNPKNFTGMMKFIAFTQIVAMAIYIAFPNRQDLRPEVFPRENIFTYIVNLLYTADTNTNVCPSLHVAYSIGIASTWFKEKTASMGKKIFILLFAITICASTTFIKQHSIVDTFVALPMCLFAEIFAFGRYWAKKLKRNKIQQNA